MFWIVFTPSDVFGHPNVIDLATQLVARILPIIVGIPITVAIFFKRVQSHPKVFEILLTIFISLFTVVTNAKFGALILVNTGGVIYPDAPISISVVVFAIMPSRTNVGLMIAIIQTITLTIITIGYGIPAIVVNMDSHLMTDTIMSMSLAIPIMIAVNIVCVAQAINVERYFRNSFRISKQLEIEKQIAQVVTNRSRATLENIFPVSFVDRLIQDSINPLPNLIDYFPNATALFSDIVNFTKYSSNTQAEDIIYMLNQHFSLVCFTTSTNNSLINVVKNPC